MADEVQIPGTQASAKVRNPLVVVILALVTFGIYFFFWYFFVNRELRDIGRGSGTDECGTSPGMSLVAMTVGWLIIVPPFVSIYNSFKRLNAASRIRIGRDGFDAGLGLVIWVFVSPIALYIFQMKMNEMLRLEGSAPPQGTAGQVASSAGSVPSTAPPGSADAESVPSPEGEQKQ